MIDELSLVVAPIVAESDDKPLFMDSVMGHYKLENVQKHGSVIWLNYK